MELASLPELAVEEYTHAVQLDASSLLARGLLVVALMKAKQYQEAAHQATTLVAEDPTFELETLIGERIPALALLGDAVAAQNKLDSAEQAYRSALASHPQNGYASGRLSQLLLQRAGHSEAVVSEAIALGLNTGEDPRFRDTRAVLRLAASSPKVITGISITPIQSILQHAVPGRPFMVGGGRRSAAIETSDSWKAELSPDLRHLDGTQRARLGEHWSEMGREEHASVGSFSRFVIQLLALGAPAELVEEATRAMNDETEHAKLCFGIASAALGHNVGVGPIEVDNCLEGSSDPWTVLHATLVEGCVGETASAAIASESLRRCNNECISSVLARIADDEARHATLAWRFTEWVLQNHPELAKNASDVFSQASAALSQTSSAPPAPEWDSALEELGALSPQLAQQQTRIAFYNDIVPRSRKLFDSVRDTVGNDISTV